MYVGKLKDCYIGKRKVFNEAPIIVKNTDNCVNARGEDFSYLYDWYKLDFNDLEVVTND